MHLLGHLFIDICIGARRKYVCEQCALTIEIPFANFRNVTVEEEPDEDNMEEIDTDNIINDGRRTRGKTIDFAKAAEELPEDGDEDDEDDDDFEEKEDDAMQE